MIKGIATVAAWLERLADKVQASSSTEDIETLLVTCARAAETAGVRSDIIGTIWQLAGWCEAQDPATERELRSIVAKIRGDIASESDASAAREMAETAQVVRERLWEHPELALLHATGVRPRLAYSPSELRLTIGEQIVSRIERPCWWRSDTDSGQHHASVLANQLVVAWKTAGVPSPLADA